MNKFYNVNSITGKELKDSENQVQFQDKKVMSIIREHNGELITPRHIWFYYRLKYKYAELQSIRRAITNLVNEGKLKYITNSNGYVISRFECPVKGFKTRGRLVVLNN